MNIQSLSLNKIKPKKLSDNRAYLYKDKIVLDFTSCEVILFEETNILNSCLFITHKELFNEELDKTAPYTSDYFIHEDIKFKEFTITSDMNSCFSAISGAGEDTYWLGSLCTSGKELSFNAYGLNYYFECYDYSKSDLYVDCFVFYYLFQFTKHLTGKKSDMIFISEAIDGIFYIANSDKSIYIKCYSLAPGFRFKINTLESIKNIYKTDVSDSKQIIKKIAIEEYNSLFKNFSRAFKDIVYTKNYEHYNIVYDDNAKLWFMKSLPE